MHGRKEIAVQALVYLCLVICSACYLSLSWTGGISFGGTLHVLKNAFTNGWGLAEILVPPFAVLLLYNFVMAVIWWSSRLIKCRNKIRVSRIWIYPNNIFCIVILLLLITPLVLGLIKDSERENLLNNTFGAGFSEEVLGYEILRSTEVEDYFFESEITELDLQQDHAVVELKDGVVLMAVFDTQRKVLALERIW